MHYRALLAATAMLFAPVIAHAQSAADRAADERPAKVVTATPGWNYERRAVDIPMRDGVKLHTVILIPKGAHDAPVILTRTPYNAEGLTTNQHSGDLGSILDGYDNAYDVITEGGYIRVVQDVRGKYGSGGIYMMNPPRAGTALNPTRTDDSTDTYDTIDWLVKHLPESNGKVGIMGISYDGFLPLMATINPHPALKVSVPMNPMVDGWRGDDWFHNGAFRQMNMPYVWEQVATRDNSSFWTSNYADDYDQYMNAGSAGELGRLHGLEQVGTWRKIVAHPAYDSYWSEQAMDRVLAKEPLKVPMMLVASQWDQEDIYGATAVYSRAQTEGQRGRHGLPVDGAVVSTARKSRPGAISARSNGTRTPPNGGATMSSRRSSRIISKGRRWTSRRSRCSKAAPTNGAGCRTGPRRAAARRSTSSPAARSASTRRAAPRRPPTMCPTPPGR